MTAPDTYADAAKVAEQVTFNEFAAMLRADDNPWVFNRPRVRRRIAMNARVRPALGGQRGYVVYDYFTRNGYAEVGTASIGYRYDRPVFTFDDGRTVQVIPEGAA